MTLHLRWLEAKEAEREAAERRRLIEDELIRQMDIKESDEGVKSIEVDGYTIKATSRLTRKIDSDLLQEIAAENDLTDHLGSLFRWKPELSMKQWKAADPAITQPLSHAITTTPGRPSFSITKKEI